MRWLLKVFAFPSLVLGHLFVGAALLTRQARKPHYRGGVLRAYHRKPRKYSTTIGHGMLLVPGAKPSTVNHELIHVEQYEDMCFIGAVLGGLLCIASWKVGLIVWATSGFFWNLLLYPVGYIRFKEKGVPHYDALYFGASPERAAYSLANNKDVTP